MPRYDRSYSNRFYGYGHSYVPKPVGAEEAERNQQLLQAMGPQIAEINESLRKAEVHGFRIFTGVALETPSLEKGPWQFKVGVDNHTATDAELRNGSNRIDYGFMNAAAVTAKRLISARTISINSLRHYRVELARN